MDILHQEMDPCTDKTYTASFVNMQIRNYTLNAGKLRWHNINKTLPDMLLLENNPLLGSKSYSALRQAATHHHAVDCFPITAVLYFLLSRPKLAILTESSQLSFRAYMSKTFHVHYEYISVIFLITASKVSPATPHIYGLFPPTPPMSFVLSHQGMHRIGV